LKYVKIGFELINPCSMLHKRAGGRSIFVRSNKSGQDYTALVLNFLVVTAILEAPDFFTAAKSAEGTRVHGV